MHPTKQICTVLFVKDDSRVDSIRPCANHDFLDFRRGPCTCVPVRSAGTVYHAADSDTSDGGRNAAAAAAAADADDSAASGPSSRFAVCRWGGN